tara:strand:- start:217 stop:666 length:450 start_codon:yes stop_codon:yes gene_type:complete
LNFLLSLNKKNILYVSIALGLFFLSFIFIKYFLSIDKKVLINSNFIPNIDITEPRFAINNNNSKILVTAKEGNFLDNDRILLNKNVLFTSENFIIETESVIFHRKEQTASSQSKSIFKSKNTKISSEGFDIYDNGNKIKFLGQAVVILK